MHRPQINSQPLFEPSIARPTGRKLLAAYITIAVLGEIYSYTVKNLIKTVIIKTIGCCASGILAVWESDELSNFHVWEQPNAGSLKLSGPTGAI